MSKTEDLRLAVQRVQSVLSEMDASYRTRSALFMSGKLDVMKLAAGEAENARLAIAISDLVKSTSRISGPENERLQQGGFPSNSWRMAQAQSALDG